MNLSLLKSEKIAVVGLGYVGLPLAVLSRLKSCSVEFTNEPSKISEEGVIIVSINSMANLAIWMKL